MFGTALLLLLTTAPATHAQDLTIVSQPVEVGIADIDYQTLAFIVIRVVLVLTLVIAAMIGGFSGYRWLTSEGNAKKAHENKLKVSRALLISTIIFVVLSILRIFVPDYTALTF